MKQVDCAQVTGSCPTGFKASSENEDELVGMVQRHAREQHRTDMDRDKARQLLR